MFHTWVPCYAMVDDLYACQLPKFHRGPHSKIAPDKVERCGETAIVGHEQLQCMLPDYHQGEHHFITSQQCKTIARINFDEFQCVLPENHSGEHHFEV